MGIKMERSYFEGLPSAERLPLILRGLYESYGYAKYRMSNFEPYDLYRENKSFLKSDGIITFTDANGRLMALKPDVTISIIKNVDDNAVAQKLYYTENVFRMNFATHEYSEISQIGLEYIGADTGYAQSEVALLALRSLEAIGADCVLCLSHMGFVSGFLSALGFEVQAVARALEALGQKNVNAIEQLCAQVGISQENTQLLRRFARVAAPLEKAVEELDCFALNGDCTAAVEELKTLCSALAAAGCGGKIVLDFSVVSDTEYYNGIVFNGYINGVPRAVLSGGRYDRLMQRFGKPQQAVGFAVYLGELDRALYEKPEYDVDTLLIYGDSPASDVAKQVACLVERGISVRAEREMPAGVRARNVQKTEKH